MEEMVVPIITIAIMVLFVGGLIAEMVYGHFKSNKKDKDNEYVRILYAASDNNSGIPTNKAFENLNINGIEINYLKGTLDGE